MRIVAGSHRGRKIESPAGLSVRPTSDRMREAVFSMLESGRFGAVLTTGTFLDLFAGTGAMGLEALSRGAPHAIFVELEARTAKALQAGLRAFGLEARGHVRQGDARKLVLPSGLPAVTLAYADPPYGKDLLAPCLEELARLDVLAPEALILAEQEAKDPVPEVAGLELLDHRRYGRAGLAIYRRLNEGAS